MKREINQRSRRDPIDEAVGHRIKTLRKAQGLSQTALANAIGVTFQQVQKYESGANRMAASTLARAAVALGCKIVDFYPQAGDVAEARDAVPVEMELTSLFRRMGDDEQSALLVVARSLASSSRPTRAIVSQSTPEARTAVQPKAASKNG